MRKGRQLRPRDFPLLLALTLALGACSERQGEPGTQPAGGAPVPAAVPAPVPPVAASKPGVPGGISIEARIRADLPPLRFVLVADNLAEQVAAPDTPLQVRAIEVRSDATLLQRIDGLQTSTPWNGTAPGFEVLDMNFDGYADIRLIESQPAGPNTPYLNWLYDPAAARFMANPALNELSAPRFDAKTREVLSDWRDGATTSGHDVYTYRDGQLLATRRETRTYKRPGVYTLEVSKRVGDSWQRVERREVRDPG